MLSRERCLDVWNGLWRSIANFTTAEVLQAVRQVALPLSSATALAHVNGTSPLPPGRGLSPFDCFFSYDSAKDRRGRRTAGVPQTASP